MSNLFGFDLLGLDIPSFASAIRLAFVAIGILGAAMAAREGSDRRTGWMVFSVGAAGYALAWFATMFPLPNAYGANGSQDRENHLGWANMVALGFSPLRTFQVNHLHFEPLWPLLTAMAAGFNLDRITTVFQWAPLVIGLAVLLSIRFAWIRGVGGSEAPHTEAAFAAMGALLLMSVPGDFSGPFRNPWALTFLLKPNHALGLVLVPLAALAISRAHDWKSRLFAGFILQLVGWAFVIHMALFVAGLAVFVALSWATRRRDRLRDLIDAGTAVGANVLLVSPYLVMLVVAYPFLQGSDLYRLSPFSERPFEGSLRLGVLFLLSAFGASRTYAGQSRLGRILAAQWLTAQLVWQAFPILGLFGQAREQDEAFYWCRLWTGLFAGVGLFQAAQLALAGLRTRGIGGRARRVGTAAAVSLLLLLPSLLPSWWDPSRMDQYFTAALKPIPDWIAEPTRFIRANTPVEAVFAGDRNYARWIAAYGARRVLLANSLNNPNDTPRRMEIEGALLRGGSPARVAEDRGRYSLEYVLVTSAPMEQALDVTLEQLATRPDLEPVYDRQFEETRVVIFKILERRRPIVQDQGLIDALRAVLAQDGSIPALRAGLFLFGILATFAWLRRRSLLALCLTSAGSVLGLGWWLVQIAFPLGLGTDAALTRDWAQAGVDALAQTGGSGFVWGTSPERSLVSTLSLLGTPLPVVHLVPQIAALLGLGLLIMLPLALIKDTATARLAACLVVGGGLWPGVSPYGVLILHPSLFVAAGVVALVAIFIVARRGGARRRFNHSRLGVAVGLMAIAALGRARGDGVEPGAISACLLIAASLVLASPARGLLRRASASARVARRNEAFVLLCVFCGSGLFWWDPPKTMPGFVEATDGSAALRKPLSWIAQNVPAGDVVLTSPAYSGLVAALAGHRVLFPPAEGATSLSEPFRRARLAASTLQGRPIARLAEAFSATHLFLGPGEPSPLPVKGTDPDDEPWLSLVLVYEDAENFRVFRLTKK